MVVLLQSIGVIVIFIVALPIIMWTVHFQMAEPSTVVAEYLLLRRIIIHIAAGVDVATVVASVIACANKKTSIYYYRCVNLTSPFSGRRGRRWLESAFINLRCVSLSVILIDQS